VNSVNDFSHLDISSCHGSSRFLAGQNGSRWFRNDQNTAMPGAFVVTLRLKGPLDRCFGSSKKLSNSARADLGMVPLNPEPAVLLGAPVT
jgi:hypothetical protein